MSSNPEQTKVPECICAICVSLRESSTVVQSMAIKYMSELQSEGDALPKVFTAQRLLVEVYSELHRKHGLMLQGEQMRRSMYDSGHRQWQNLPSKPRPSGSLPGKLEVSRFTPYGEQGGYAQSGARSRGNSNSSTETVKPEARSGSSSNSKSTVKLETRSGSNNSSVSTVRAGADSSQWF